MHCIRHDQESELIKRTRTLLTLGVAIATIAMSACDRVKGQSQAPPPNRGATTPTPTVLVAPVRSQFLERQVALPAELVAFQDVPMHPRVQGFVESIGVDRGSIVKRGQRLIRMVAPELDAQRGEADAKAQSAQAQRTEAEAKLASDDATYQRLKSAAATPGVVAGNDVEVAQRTVDADRARVESSKRNEQAAADAAKSVRQMQAYLQVNAPFDGVITERNVHQGTLVGPSSGPMLRIQQVSRLRLVVYVPEVEVAGIRSGQEVRFTVPAFPGESFSAKVQRIGHSLDTKTRSMAVELDVMNRDRRLAPGMFAQVQWPARRSKPSLVVPGTAVATTTERTFVVRVREGTTEWVDVKKGAALQGLVEVFGDLKSGDQVAIRGTDELRAGTRVNTKPAADTR